MKTLTVWLLSIVVVLSAQVAGGAPQTREAWLLSAMAEWAPIAKKPVGETAEQAATRRAEIVRDLLIVTNDPEERPLFGGANARALTAAFMLAWSVEESGGWHLFVDNGKWRGDSKDNTFNGTSWCITQQNIGGGRTWAWNRKAYRAALPGDSPADVTPGSTGPELIKDRTKCWRAALHVFHNSVTACAAMHPPVKSEGGKINPDVFSAYASAQGCTPGMATVHARYNRFRAFITAHPAP